MMKKKLFPILLILCMMTGLLSAGCGNHNRSGDISLYYLNLEGTSIVQSYYNPEDAGELEGIDLYLHALADDPDEDDIMKTIPDSVKVLDYSLDNYFLTLNFSEQYYDIPKAEEVLVRAAIVRTLTQLDDVVYVSFNVEGVALTNARGEVVGSMNADSFVENPDAAINTSQEKTLTLYFSSSDGTYLVPETQTVYYSSNESLEKLIVKKLIAGPSTSGAVATIPATTHIITVSLMDGVCYVNLDANFMDQNQEISEEVVLYSIVDSLTELDEVKKVQLSINGDTSGMVRYIYKLSDMYERNESFIQTVTDAEEETQD
ncbi:MAG: sporulation and spore germination [Lachnospiraceae bacterium]|nr:sporulation and spore germination [Lachnospiraceae bacterium]